MINTSQEYFYHGLLQEVLHNGTSKNDRTNTGTISLFRPSTMIFELEDGRTFPLLTKKKINFNVILKELLWFISGSTTINTLDSKIWDSWANENGSVGPMYGEHFRNIGGYDPLKDTIENIKNNPHSRRHVMTTWRHELLPDESLMPQENVKNGKQALANCHGTVIQFYVEGDKLSLSHYQRSADLFLGLPFNIASYATLLMMVAKITGYKADKLYFDIGDAHIYNNHINQVEEYLDRSILSDFPSLIIYNRLIDDITQFTVDDFLLKYYDPQPFIKAEISV